MQCASSSLLYLQLGSVLCYLQLGVIGSCLFCVCRGGAIVPVSFLKNIRRVSKSFIPKRQVCDAVLLRS